MFMVILVSSAGGLAGAALARIAREEMKDGMSYFRILFSSIAVVLLFLMAYEYISYFAVITLVATFFLYREHKILLRYIIISVIYGIFLARTATDPSISAVLFFLAGLAAGTIYVADVAEGEFPVFAKRASGMMLIMVLSLSSYLISSLF